MSVDPSVPEAQTYPPAPRFQLVPAAYVVLQRDGTAGTEVLLQLRTGTGYMDGHWACGAAGHVEAGEDAPAAAVRETREELGIEVTREDLRPLTAMHRTHGNGRAIDERVDFFFTARRWRSDPRPLEATAAELRWAPLTGLDDLGAPVVPHERYVLDRLADGALPAVTSFGFPESARPPGG